MKCSTAFLFAPVVTAAASSWSGFGYDAQHSGYAPDSPTPSGVEAWVYHTNEYQQSSAVFSATGDTVYMANDGGSVFAFDVATGALNWEYRKAAFTNIWSTPAVGEDGRLFFGSFDGTVTAISSNGTELWTSQQTGGVVNTSPSLDSEGNLYVGSTSGQMGSYTPDGAERWTYVAPGPLRSSPALASDESALFGATTTGEVFSLDPNTGALHWQVSPIFRSSYFSSPTVVPGSGLVLLATELCGGCPQRDPARLIALEPATGNVAWQLGIGANTQSTAAIFNSQGVIANKDGHLIAFDVMTGQESWRLFLGGRIRSSPTIAGDGTIFIGTPAGISAVSQSGELLWEYSVNGDVLSSPSIGPDGTLVFGNLGDFDEGARSIYALR